jgi:subtilisin family serine protease
VEAGDITNRPTRLIVKFKAPLAQQIEASLPASELELHEPPLPVRDLAKGHKVKKLHPLYRERVRAKKERGMTDDGMANSMRNRFPKRAGRHHGAFDPPELSRTYVLELDASSRQELGNIVERLKADPNVEFAQPDQVVTVQFIPNDPYFSSTGSWGQGFDDLYGLKNISCPAAWNLSTGAGIVVAVIDTGIDYRHPDITNNVWMNPGEIPDNGLDDDKNGFVDDVRGWDFVGRSYLSPEPDNDPLDEGHGHGTHVAGTIAAEGNNGRGIIGVAWGAKVMAVKGLADDGYGLDSYLANAIMYATDNGADVINASWGGRGRSLVIEEAVDYATAAGVVFVAAAGNNDEDVSTFYPASVSSAISVSASDVADSKAYFSNFGMRVDVGAPGVDVLSLRADGTQLGGGQIVGDEYVVGSGTSMAAPHVAGVAALILSRRPESSPEEIRQVLRISADDFPEYTQSRPRGYGRVNAFHALVTGPVLQTRIKTPTDGTWATVPIQVQGIAKGRGFARYVLDYGLGESPALWTLIQESVAPADGATLGIFDPTRLPDGRYTLRLRALNTLDQTFEDKIRLRVDYVYITEPSVPRTPATPQIYKPGVLVNVYGNAVGPDFERFQLEWARGWNATDGWSSASISLSGNGLLQVTNGLLGSFDSSSISEADYYTIRLRVENTLFTNDATTVVYFEPDLLSTNWPQWLDIGPYLASTVPVRDSEDRSTLAAVNPFYDINVSPSPPRLWWFAPGGMARQIIALDGGGWRQPAAADLDGASGQEVVVSEQSSLRVFRSDGTSYILSHSHPVSFSHSFVHVHDLDGDTHPEVLALGSDTNTRTAYLFAWQQDGHQLSANFPIPIPDANDILRFPRHPAIRALALDLDRDGRKEILVVGGPGNHMFTLRLFQFDGRPATWPRLSFDGTLHQLAAADLDHDGQPEIILSYEIFKNSSVTNFIHVLSADGTARQGWPVIVKPDGTDFLRVVEEPIYLAISDIDRDGREEIVVSGRNLLHILEANGTAFSVAWPRHKSYPGYYVYSPVAVGDIDGDGLPEVVVCRSSLKPLDTQTHSASAVTGLPSVRADEASINPPTIRVASALGTQAATLVQTAGSGAAKLYSATELIALRADATIARSWRLLGLNGNQPLGQDVMPVLDDFDGNGKVDVALNYSLISGGGVGGPLVEGVLTVLGLEAPYQPNPSDWPMNYHDPQNTATGFIPTPQNPGHPPTYISLEAEAATLAGPMALFSDPQASQEGYISSPTRDQGSALFTVSIPHTGQYVIWCRVLAPNAGQDSFFVNVDQSNLDTNVTNIYDVAQGTWTNVWQWTRVNQRDFNNISLATDPRLFNLSAGTHTIVFGGREANTKLDRLIITDDLSLMPDLPATISFQNSTAISIPAVGPDGAATPYPSKILVSGVPGDVSKLRVQLNQLSHDAPDDLDILLVGPTGQAVLLMSDAGGRSPVYSARLTFADAAEATLPDEGPIVSGTFRPADFEPGSDWLPWPAPIGPYGTSLSALAGTNPNGLWSLYVFDDFPGAAGGWINDGWQLSITTLSNSHPSVNLVRPTEGQEFVAPGTITLEASATDSDGAIVLVEFFEIIFGNDYLKLGQATNSPYTLSWTNVGRGPHALTAIALDNDGARATSSVVHVTVIGLIQAWVNAAQPGATIEIPAGTYLDNVIIDKDLTLRGATAATTIVDGERRGRRVFVINSNSTVFIQNLTISNGSGGIRNFGTVTLENCVVINNQIGYGGGIYNLGSMAVHNSTICGNSVGARGGFGQGGGILNVGSLTLENCTISGNSAAYSGGGVSNYDGLLAMTHCTVSANRAGDSGGIWNSGTIQLKNSILAGNVAGFGLAADCLGPLQSQGYNLIQNTNGCTLTSDTTGNIVGQDPLLGPLQDNGGPTLTHALLPGSPAIDQGSCDDVTTDQRGVPRPQDVPAIVNARDGCDIGAYEFAPLRLHAPQPLADGSVRLCMSRADGLPVEASRLPRIEVYATTNVARRLTDWTRLTNGLVLRDGWVWLDDPESALFSRRFYQVIERP